ncbi:PEP-CTERM sorting domain-containing protein [Oxalobacteraceae bacterium]|nr:PEP-CTERM sorting domain-containing protein [Oxalobacteraceae bacterium]
MDTNTGRVWLDMDNFFDAGANVGTSGFGMIAAANAAGFSIANLADVQQLFSTLPLSGGEWPSYAAVMGYGQPRQLIWGMYEGGYSPDYPWAYAWSSDSYWNFGGNTYGPGVQNDGNSGSVDMGIWAYQTNPVPEPDTWLMTLGGLGLLAALARRRRV